MLILAEIGQSLLGRQDLMSEAPSGHVLAATLLYLFGAKLMGVGWVLADRQRRRSFGGAASVLRSALIEILLSILLAPVTMVTQTKSLIGLALGIPSNWTAQRREASGLRLRDVLPKVREHLALGLAFVGVGFVDPVLGLWLAPVTVGLLSAPWLIALTSSASLGGRLAAHGFFTVPPPEMGQADVPGNDGAASASPAKAGARRRDR